MSDFINNPSKEELTKPPKRKKRWAIILAVLGVCSSIIGCGDADSYIETSTGNTIQETDASLIQTATETTENTTVFADCPEGYVYDYQVSMEPIPEEIAALGGPCQGTIHAYPSRIAMALTELQMEEDPVLKAEVEKRIPEIEAALEEEIGGDFVVDGVILQDELSWVFICTEVATGYQFDLYYANQEYYAQIYNMLSIPNVMTVEQYYKGQENYVLQEELVPVIEEYYYSADIKVNSQLFANTVDIIIVQYADEEVNRCLEQERVLMLWEGLQKYKDTLCFNIYFIYYPHEYKQLVEEKFNSSVRYDFWSAGIEYGVTQLIDNREMYSCLYCDGLNLAEENNDLNVLLQQYQTGTYDNTVIWDYWVE